MNDNAFGPKFDNEQQQQQQHQQQHQALDPVSSSAANNKGSTEDTTNRTVLQQPSCQRNRPSNEYVLNVAFVSFIGFVAFQAIFAVIAHSQSMLADSEAMSVDAMTYLLNLLAERIKHTPYSPYELQLSLPVRHYRRELVRLYLEFLPPFISVITLMVVTIVVLQQALQTLRHDVYDLESMGNAAAINHYNYNNNNNNITTHDVVVVVPNDDDNVSLPIMLLFSSGNLILDILNVTCFARAHNAFGLQVVERETPSSLLPPDDDDEDEEEAATRTVEHENPTRVAGPGSVDNDDDVQEETSLLFGQRKLSVSGDPTDYATMTTTTTTTTTTIAAITNPHLSTLDSFQRQASMKDLGEKSTINLNMCSAWTHVCADTLRSVAVLVAAAIATLVPGVESGMADASAAVAVSIIILASLIPLLHGLYEVSCEIYEHWTRKP